MNVTAIKERIIDLRQRDVTIYSEHGIIEQGKTHCLNIIRHGDTWQVMYQAQPYAAVETCEFEDSEFTDSMGICDGCGMTRPIALVEDGAEFCAECAALGREDTTEQSMADYYRETGAPLCQDDYEYMTHSGRYAA